MARRAKHAAKKVKKKFARGTRKEKKKSVRKVVKRVSKKIVRRKITSRKKTVKKTSRHASKKVSNSSKKVKSVTSLARILDIERNKLRPARFSEPSVDKFLIELRKKIPNAQIVPGGSYAKGTFIKGIHDVDMFVRFPHGTPDTVMSETIAKVVPRATRVHGSRDYFQLKNGNYVFELVPVLAIAHVSEAQNVTDHSPLHVEYVAALLTPALKDDARLAKQFCKGAGIYGAESYVHGFSGYVLEILIGYYGGFENLLRASVDWTKPIVIDPAKHYANSASALLRLNEAKVTSPIILIDPVFAERNAAAALSDECFVRFQERAAEFLTAPSLKFFDSKITRAEIKKKWKATHKNATILFVTAKTPKGKQDIVGCKVLAKHELARDMLIENDFGLVHAEWRFGEKESLCWYVIERTTLPKLDEQRGPPSDMKSAVIAFSMKHTNAFLRDGRYYAPIKRKYTKSSVVLKFAWKGMKAKFS